MTKIAHCFVHGLEKTISIAEALHYVYIGAIELIEISLP